MKFSRYCKTYKSDVDPDAVILFSTKKASKIVIPESMLKDIEGRRITEEERETLTDLGFLVTSAEDEKAEIGKFIDDLNAIDTIFAAKVVMNLDCNFACKYCFEGQRKGKFFMTREMADCFVEFMKAKVVSQERTFKEIRLTFYGGEPLLSVDLIKYISERIKAIAKDNGIAYTAYIITNGSLLNRRNVEILRALELKEAAVTIDGPKEIHDQSRPFRTGNGSFDIIIRNLKEACELIDIEVGGNFTRDNYREFPRLLDYMMEEGLTPDKLSGVRFDPVTQESEGIALPDFRDGCASFNEPWLLEAGIYLREETLRRGYQTGKITPMPCLLDIKNRLVVNYDGSIYKCPGLIGREEFKVGDLKTGIKDYHTSHNMDNWKNDECLNCAYLPLCFGGCRYMKLNRDGNMKGVDCKKPYFDAVLEALVKQDIKYGMPMCNEILKLSDEFNFGCNDRLDCFPKCCRDVNIWLTPYDILRIKNNLGLASNEFLKLYTKTSFPKEGGYPTVSIKMNSDSLKSCPLSDYKGCVVYPDRPWVCRMFPLVPVFNDVRPAPVVDSPDPEFMINRWEVCMAYGKGENISVSEWRKQQGSIFYEEVNADWKKVIHHKDFLSRDLLKGPYADLFFTACYDIDEFRKMVFKEGFLKNIDMDKDVMKKLASDDTELLKFSFRWLRHVLFNEDMQGMSRK